MSGFILFLGLAGLIVIADKAAKVNTGWTEMLVAFGAWVGVIAIAMYILW
jgi:hypothetical protein